MPLPISPSMKRHFVCTWAAESQRRTLESSDVVAIIALEGWGATTVALQKQLDPTSSNVHFIQLIPCCSNHTLIIHPTNGTDARSYIRVDDGSQINLLDDLVAVVPKLQEPIFTPCDDPFFG